MYESITQGVKVIVQPKYLEGQSKPEEGHYVWAYSITIENHSRETVTLRTRYWKITDAAGHVQEVRGAGVWRRHANRGRRGVVEEASVFVIGDDQ